MQTVTTDDLPPAVSAAALAAVRSGVTILDVRTPAEFEASHISGSYNVPLDLLPEHAAALEQAAGEPIVLVCRSGGRARQAEQALRAADLPRLHVLDGGLSAWEAGGYPVVRGRQVWSMERQVRGVAGTLVLLGAAGSFVAPPLALLAAGVGAGLVASAVLDSCTMAKLLGKLPYNQAATCNVDLAIKDIAARRTATTAAD